eukprot:CAMPEP_0206236562 /NCGR_PEP_ID=MMETSP0047_2-20121206/13786_1 /ASSEMBLY_ACC=CAM_ASM_000192 /TAXON_ID=195065 /ORGANISM="Chroomonas mesostigmatica_cf, Strain CCMP1168" /LENGTH=190 /DNA_ID=CAMNT_0053660915 /DNA_START=665 /DNA_END=1238 /DNA_ORIENTATION=+
MGPISGMLLSGGRTLARAMFSQDGAQFRHASERQADLVDLDHRIFTTFFWLEALCQAASARRADLAAHISSSQALLMSGAHLGISAFASAATAFSRRQRPLMTDGAAATTQHFHAGQGRPRQRAQRRRGQAQTNLGMPSNHCGSGLDSWGRGDAVRQGDDSTCCSCCGFDARLDRAFALLHWRDFALACF